MRYIVFVLIALILLSLGSALFHIVTSKQTNLKVVRNLTWRVALSITLFLLLMISHQLGWIGDRI